MKKYFKPLDFLFYFNCVGIICWIIVLFQANNNFPVWLKIVLLTVILIKQLTYVKWERIRINFDWILNIIYRKKLLELNKKYKLDFYFLPKHNSGYSLDSYSTTETSLFQSYQISRVCTKYINNQIWFCIELKRPGILIGRKGSNLEEIQKLLNCKIFIKECKDIWFTKQNNIF